MNLIQELRQAARRLARRPLLSLLALTTLALGIGANTAVFSLLEGVVLRALPLPDSGRLVYLRELDPDGSTSNLGFTTYRDLAARTRSFESVAASASRQPILDGDKGEEAETLDGLAVSASWLPTLGVAPLQGRNVAPDEDRPGAARVVLLGHALWTRRFGADPAVVGRTIRLNDQPHEVIGVLPPELDRLIGPGTSRRLDLVTALRYSVEQEWACRTCRHIVALGRLRTGVSVAAANADLNAAVAALAAEYPKEYPTPRGAVVPARDELSLKAKPLLSALFLGVSLVLLLAVANVAALLAVRTLEREQELAVRRSLGAGARQLLVAAWSESLLLAAAGGLLGIAVARPLLRLLVAFAPGGLPRLDGLDLDGPVLLFAFATSLVAASAAGIAPALVHLRSSARGLLAAKAVAGVGRERRRALGRLVVAELALALVVVFAAALVGRSLERTLAEEPGFRSTGVTVATVNLNGSRYDEDAAANAFFAEASERLGALPGVEAVGWTSQLPLGGNSDTYTLRFESRPAMRLDEEPAADRYAVSPGYFRALGLRLVEGRFLAASDRAGAEPVAIVNRSLAVTIWPGASALGQRLRMGGEDAPLRTIVGVVDDVRHRGLDEPSQAQFYVTPEQWFFADSERSLVVRSTLPPSEIAARLRATLRELDPRVPIQEIRSMESVVAESTGGRRFAAGVWSSFAGLALLLAALGTYGLLARQVAMRRRELGVRTALGAAPRRLAREVASDAFRLALTAILVALPLAWAAGRLLASELWRIPPSDPLSFAIAVVVIAAVAAVAALVPARRAASTDPATVLRAE